MRHITSFFICLALALLSGCASRDTTKLRIGMTKEEVFQAMGQPDSVGAENQYEYLNYHINNQGYLYTTQAYTVRLQNGRVDSFGVGGQVMTRTLIPARELAQNPAASESGIRILSIEPASATPDKVAEFKFKIAYSFKEGSSGLVQIAVNVDEPKNYRTLVSKAVTTASGEVELTATLTPKDWGKFVGFAANAVLRTGTETVPGKAVAFYNREIPLTKQP